MARCRAMAAGAALALLLGLAAAAADAGAAAAAGGGAWPADPATMPAYVITLKRTPKRLEYFMKTGTVASQLPQLQVFEAVDGKTLDPVNDERFSVLARVNLIRKTRRSHTDLVTAGMAGLYISHVEVWKAVVASGAPLAIVLEDDAEIPADFQERWAAVMAQLPPPTEWDVYILGCLSVGGHHPGPGLHPAIHEVAEYFGTQAYVVTARGAQRLLRVAYPMAVQVDAFMAQASTLGLVRTLWRHDGFLDVRQLFWAGTTVQQLYCDLCNLPHDYNRVADVLKWLALGLALGMGLMRLPQSVVERVPGLRLCAGRCRRQTAAAKRAGDYAS